MKPYDPALSLRLAEAAVASYSGHDVLADWSSRRGMVCRAWSEGAAQAAVFCADTTRDGEVIVAIRGTDEGLDWRVDTRLWRVRRSWWSYPDEDGKPIGRLHRGFVSYAERLSSLIAEEVARWPDRPVHVCGHSLGGALSYLIARDLSRRGRDIATVHAFSSPRVGGRKWAQAYDAGPLGSLTFRVVAVLRGAQDLVTQTPPAAFGYWHAGRPVIVSGAERWESEAMWEQVRTLPKWRFVSRLFRGVSAHPSRSLMAVLRADAERAEAA